MGNFVTVIDAFVTKSEKLTLAIRNESTKRLISLAQRSDDKGGRMRVDTGFLRASGTLSLTGMPSGPVRPFADAIANDPRYIGDEYGSSPVVVMLANSTLNDSLFFGWTANYAIYREWHDNFLKLAVQQWPNIVNEVTNELKARIK